MKFGPSLFLACAMLLLPWLTAAQPASRVDSTARRLADAGFANVRAVETPEFTVFTVENDYYKIPAEGFARAIQIIEGAGVDTSKPVKLIGTAYRIPELTITYDPGAGQWRSTKRLDASWDAVRKEPLLNNSFGKSDLAIYPALSLTNLIITQVYQSLWELKPALSVSLWPGAQFTYQLVIPVFSDFFDASTKKVHPGFITFSQRFRDPWHLNILGKFSVGNFSTNRFGAVLEAAYWFPNERFWVNTQLGVIAPARFNGFRWQWVDAPFFAWNVAGNYYNARLQTQFILRAQRCMEGDYGLKFEMIRHFRHCSIGFYAQRGVEIFDGIVYHTPHTNGGFRFQIALPPYRMKRHGYIPRVSTSGQMGMAYNANNEQKFYKEFRTEATDNIMSLNYYNPYYINSQLSR
ncbi:MAG: hypothetical protein IJK55_03185 [Bacteroidales bacterium]|nr:hypothetical protein [Bacteroidales bacterium]